MSLNVDPNNQWRSGAFTAIPVVYSAINPVARGRPEGKYVPESAVSGKTAREWLESVDTSRLSRTSARDAMMSGMLDVIVEVSSTELKSADDAIARVYTLPYGYGGSKRTQLHFTHAGSHFVARPVVNETVVAALYSAPSADKWSAAAGIKLPRVTTSGGPAATVPGMPNYSEVGGAQSSSTPFEFARRYIAEHAKMDDYGDRLFNLARVVCHATVLRTLGIHPSRTAAMEAANLYSILSADTTALTVDALEASVFAFTHTEASADYKAFLTMGLRGVQNYAGVDTVYSNCLVEAEASVKSDIIFVRTAGEATDLREGLPVDAYLRVLRDADLCRDYYDAYARSMGLGDVAAAVLVQAAVGPHIWGADAVSPYKNCRPKLDAARYTILPSESTGSLSVSGLDALVHSAAIVGWTLKVGLGGVLMSFEAGREVDSMAVANAVLRKLGDPETRRSIVHAVTSRHANGSVGLQWLSPFSYDVNAGMQECVAAWRDYSFLLADYNVCPISTLTACVDGGVNMTNSLIGRGTVSNNKSYAQVVVGCIAAGLNAPGMCERLNQALLAGLGPTMRRMRAWRPVVTLVRFRGQVSQSTAEQVSPPPNARIAAVPPVSETASSHTRTSSQELRSIPDDAMLPSDTEEYGQAPVVVRSTQRASVRFHGVSRSVSTNRPGSGGEPPSSNEEATTSKVQKLNTVGTRVIAGVPLSSTGSSNNDVLGHFRSRSLSSTTEEGGLRPLSLLGRGASKEIVPKPNSDATTVVGPTPPIVEEASPTAKRPRKYQGLLGSNKATPATAGVEAREAVKAPSSDGARTQVLPADSMTL